MFCQSTCKDKGKKYLRCGRRKGNLPHANARLLSFAVKTMQANFILILWRDFAIAEGFFKMQARFLPPVDVLRGFRAPCRQNIYFAMFACSCKGRRFQNRCVNCGTKCSPVFTVELILIFFVQTTLFLPAFKNLSGYFAKNFFSILNISFFCVFPNKMLPVSDNHGTKSLFLFFPAHTTLFLLAFKKFVRLLCKKFFLFCKLFLFSAFFPKDCCPFPIITAGICFFLLTTPFVKL